MTNTLSHLEVSASIDNGSYVCKKLKQMFPDLSWWAIAAKFTVLKNATRKFYPESTESQFIVRLVNYSLEDITEALSLTRLSTDSVDNLKEIR